MRISYAIPVCNEDKELDRLLAQLLFHELGHVECLNHGKNFIPTVKRLARKYERLVL